MARSRWGIRGLLAGLAALGVVAAHAIAYAVAVPDPSIRAAVLHATGHGGWSFLLAFAAGALLLGLTGFLVAALRNPSRPTPVTFRFGALRLGVFQTLGFLSLESIERVLSGHGIEHFLREPVVWIGVVIQLAVALLGALLLVGLGKVVAFFTKPKAEPRLRARTTLWPHLEILGPRFDVATGSGTLRGPPVAR